MTASYPSSIWTPSHITSGTVLESVLLHRAGEEIDAIEAELGIKIHGSAGSLAERLDLFMDADSGVPNLKLCDSTDTQRRRIRAGTTLVSIDDLTRNTRSSLGTITFSPPLAPLVNAAYALLEIQTLDLEDLANPSIPSFVCFVNGSGTTTSFQYRVGSGANAPAASGTQFILHWLAFDSSTYSTNLELP